MPEFVVGDPVTKPLDGRHRGGGMNAPVVRTWADRVEFWCPGCDDRHAISTGPDGWTWNGDRTCPTFSPSVLAHPHQAVVDPDLTGEALWAPENVRTTPRCHSFVTDGRIAFLGDSTHPLAGETVDLPVWPADLPGDRRVVRPGSITEES